MLPVEPIKDTIINVMQEWGTKKKGISGNDPWGLLKKSLTKKELRHIKFNYFKKGVLGLYVDSSVWLYNLNLKKENLLSKLNSEFSNIKDIRFRLGGFLTG